MAEPPLLIDKTMKQFEFLFRCCGINIKVGEKTQKDKIRNYFIFFLNSITLHLDVGGALLWLVYGIAQKKKVTELTYGAPCVIYSYFGITKGIFMVINESNIDVLTNRLRKLEIDQKNRRKNEETEKIIEEENNYLTKLIKVLNVFYTVLLLGFALSPLLLVLLNYLKTNEVELLFPFLILYPFDPFDMRYYPWLYLRQVWSEIVLVFGIAASDFMFYTYCTYLRIQFRLVGHYIERIIPSGSRNRALYNKEEVRLKLVDLIKWHQELISCVNILETLYTKCTLVNFLASSLLICLTAFNVTAFDDTAFVLTFLSFLLTSVLQIFFLCLFGNLLMESSMEIGDSVYNSKWYLSDPSLKKYLLLIQTRAQSPCKLTACSFADVNLKAFMKICSTSWSYFALLQTLYTGPSQ